MGPGRVVFTRPGSSPCENAKTLDRDRTSYSFNATLAAQAASPFTFEIEPENIILVALRVFEFSHSLGQKRTSLADRFLAQLRTNHLDRYKLDPSKERILDENWCGRICACHECEADA
jgi:hypothetical protein